MLCYKYAIQCHANEKQVEPKNFLYYSPYRLKIHSIVIIIGREAQITCKRFADVFWDDGKNWISI